MRKEEEISRQLETTERSGSFQETCEVHQNCGSEAIRHIRHKVRYKRGTRQQKIRRKMAGIVMTVTKQISDVCCQSLRLNRLRTAEKSGVSKRSSVCITP
jgi:hypothetical protein